MKTKTINDIDVAGSRVLLRVDYNVQVDERGVVGDMRIRESLDTIRSLQNAGARIVICSHRGRPRGGKVEGLRNAPIADHLSSLLHCPVVSVDDCVGPEVSSAVDKLQSGELLLLENVRFHAGEEENDTGFARELAGLADVYVNDAFGAAHRAHASIVGVPKFLPSAAGLLLEREVEYLGRVTDDPELPFGLLLGGAKMSDKLLMLEHLCDRADVICVGGGMANTFLKAQGVDVQRSLVEDDRLNVAREILSRVDARPEATLLLPTDVVTSFGAPESEAVSVVPCTEVPSGWRIVDIGPASVQAFTTAFLGVRTAVWNGPVGVFEQDQSAQGSLEMARTFATLPGITVIGGGETAAVVDRVGMRDQMSHVSTGGGASLAMLEGRVLPGVEALQDS